jgi:predicted TIM-barrel enzyme
MAEATAMSFDAVFGCNYVPRFFNCDHGVTVHKENCGRFRIPGTTLVAAGAAQAQPRDAEENGGLINSIIVQGTERVRTLAAETLWGLLPLSIASEGRPK